MKMKRNGIYKLYLLGLTGTFIALAGVFHAFAAGSQTPDDEQSPDWKPITVYILTDSPEPECRVKLHVRVWDGEKGVSAQEAVLSARAGGRQMQVSTDEQGLLIISAPQGSELIIGMKDHISCSVVTPEESDHCDSVCFRPVQLDTLGGEQLVSIPDYEEDPPVQTVEDQSADVPDNTIYMVVEQMPTFDGGGADAFMQWAAGEVRYPAGECVQCRVVARFVVEPDGSVSDIEILRSPDEWFSVEARRVVEASSGRWNPGLHRGEKVRVQYAQLIRWNSLAESDAEEPVAEVTHD